MKKNNLLLGILALALVLGMTACGDDDGGGGGGGGSAETLTYKGKGATSGDTYTLTIKKTAARAFAPIQGDEFELTDGTDKSKGTVDTFSGSSFTLQPSNDGAPTFGATVSGNDLTGLSGTITLTDGRKVTVNETITPVTPPVTGGGWTIVDVSSTFGLSNGIRDIVYGGSAGQEKFVALGDSGAAYSSDGKTWTPIVNIGSSAIAYGNGKFVVGGGLRKWWHSSDGITWTALSDDPTVTPNKIAYGGPAGQEKFVAVGSGVAYSSDGVTWTNIKWTDEEYNALNTTLHSVAWGNDKFVVVGKSGKMAYSADGVTWTAVPNSIFGSGDSDNIYAIAYGGGKWVAGGNGTGVIMAYSPDGITWTRVTGGAPINAIAYGNGKWVAVTSNRMATSSDGITWTTEVVSDLPGKAIAYGNGTWVAAGVSLRIAYSKD